MTSSHRGLACVSALAGVLAAARVQANLAGPPPPAEVGALAAEKTPLEAIDEVLTFDCRNMRADPHCDFVATYRVHNPTAAAIRQPVMFASGYIEKVDLTIDGQPAPLELTPEEDARVRALDEVERAEFKQAFRLDIAAGATRTIVARGTAYVGNLLKASSYSMPAAYVRHPAFGTESIRRGYRLRYWLAPIKTWSGNANLRVELRTPRDVKLSSPNGPLLGLDQQTATEDVYTMKTTAKDAPHMLDVTVEIPPPWMWPGGFLLGIGGTAGDDPGPRFRVGGELAFQEWLLASTVYELSHGHHHVVPALHLASSLNVPIPSFGVGLGAPIRFDPSPRVGARLQLDMALGPLMFLMMFDGYPNTSRAESVLQASFMFQLGL